MKVKIKRWHGVATWRWDVNDERCGICYTAFEACCPDCHIPGDDCPPVWGRCSHAFHMHCIMKVGSYTSRGERREEERGVHVHSPFHPPPHPPQWLNSQQNANKQTCPACRAAWEFRGAETP